MPIGLVPTTGAAITVKYGPTPHTRITLVNGEEITASDTDILQQYATLDDHRRMRDDVAAVEVLCPHPFLKMGVTLIDLPGTDDQDAQDALVRDQLLYADLVVQLLDGRKLMTLGEREHVRDWLCDRNINTVIFVANFLNLMEPTDQQQVTQRLRFLAESFRTDLPAGVSNLYRVDALPALRARLKGDQSAAQTTGLPAFEAALQSIVQSAGVQDKGNADLSTELAEKRLSRLKQVVPQVKSVLEAQLQRLEKGAATQQQQKDEKKQAIQQKAQKLIYQGFQQAVDELEQWLALPNLLNLYQSELAIALQQFDHKNWVDLALKPVWQQKQKEVVGWVHKAAEFFEQPRPAELWVAFPEEPDVAAPSAPAPDRKSKTGEIGAAPVAVATGLGWLLGGPLGAAVLGGTGYMLSKTGQSASSRRSTSQQPDYFDQMDRIYAAAAEVYLTRFSRDALKSLAEYEIAARKTLTIADTTSTPMDNQNQAQIDLIKATLDELE